MSSCAVLLGAVLALCSGCSEESSPADRPPSCVVVSPADGASFAFGDTVEVLVDAYDPEGQPLSVRFFVDGVLRFTDREPPYVYVVDGIAYGAGERSISAAASDPEGNETSDSVTITVISPTTPVYGVRVVAQHPHDPRAFTQGLAYDAGFLYEGTGLWGQSSIRKVEISSGEVLLSRSLPTAYFGEGIAIVCDTIYQLTWKSGAGFIYTKADFDSVGTFSYGTEGWGLTTDGSRLIMSDGSSTLYVLDPFSFSVTGEIEVVEAGEPVRELNELEYIEGEIFANLWRRDSPYRYRIARISPRSGEVTGWIELRNIVDDHSEQGVLNGIAFDAALRRIFLTGKNWDILYEIELTY